MKLPEHLDVSLSLLIYSPNTICSVNLVNGTIKAIFESENMEMENSQENPYKK